MLKKRSRYGMNTILRVLKRPSKSDEFLILSPVSKSEERFIIIAGTEQKAKNFQVRTEQLIE